MISNSKCLIKSNNPPIFQSVLKLKLCILIITTLYQRTLKKRNFLKLKKGTLYSTIHNDGMIFF